VVVVQVVQVAMEVQLPVAQVVAEQQIQLLEFPLLTLVVAVVAMVLVLVLVERVVLAVAVQV
jgi:hypothetical protein